MFKKYHRENYSKINVNNYNRRARSKPIKYYVVTKGWVSGIYTNKSKAQAQLKGYSGSYMKSFKSKQEAIDYYCTSEFEKINVVFKYEE